MRLTENATTAGGEFSDPNGFAPPPIPAATSAPSPTAAAATPGVASADPVPDLAADRAAGKVEELGEISSSTAGAPLPATGQLCKMENCGVIVAIYPGQPADRRSAGLGVGHVTVPLLLGQRSNLWPSPYVGYDAWDSPMGPYAQGYVMTTTPALWQIVVQMNTGAKRYIQQNYRPFLQLGDPVVVNGNNIRLWN